jgi:hypothetical protein
MEHEDALAERDHDRKEEDAGEVLLVHAKRR